MDDLNPFDQFASDFKAAIPAAPAPAAPAPANLEPPKPSGPPMNAPPMANVPPTGGAPMYGGFGGAPPGMGRHPGAMYGQGGPPPGPPMQGGMGGPPPLGGPPMMGQQYPPRLGGGMGMQQQGMLVPSAQQSNPYANMLAVAPAGQAPPPAMGQHPPPPNQFGGPPAPPPGPLNTLAAPAPPAPMQPAPTNFDIFGGGGAPVAPPAQVPPPSNAMQPYQPGPPPPQQQQQQRQLPPPQDGGFGGLFDPMAPPPPQQAPHADPWGAPAPAQTSIVPAPASVDPFGGIFGSPTPAPPAPSGPPQPVSNDDLWGDAFGAAPTPVPVIKPEDDNSTVGGGTISDMRNAVNTNVNPEADFFSTGPTTGKPSAPKTEEPKKSQLPEGGEYFDARIFTPTLGVMFFKPQELTDSLFLQTDKETVDSFEERPVVAFIVEGSSARSAGVELGNVLLKVNGIDVRNPKEASRLIKEGPRPLPLLFYVPNTTVVVAEGEHMVKYDTRETGAPLSAKDWKPKYVVIGGIIAQPWMMNMYRSKAEYDIAVIETQARRPVSVKVKQFSLQGARIQNDWQGPQMVKYKNKLHPWKFIVVLPVSRNPIKISASNLSYLKPVHEGIRRVLMVQQRGATPGIRGPTAAPVRTNDPYNNGEDRANATEGGIGSARRKTAY